MGKNSFPFLPLSYHKAKKKNKKNKFMVPVYKPVARMVDASVVGVDQFVIPPKLWTYIVNNWAGVETTYLGSAELKEGRFRIRWIVRAGYGDYSYVEIGEDDIDKYVDMAIADGCYDGINVHIHTHPSENTEPSLTDIKTYENWMRALPHDSRALFAIVGFPFVKAMAYYKDASGIYRVDVPVYLEGSDNPLTDNTVDIASQYYYYGWDTTTTTFKGYLSDYDIMSALRRVPQSEAKFLGLLAAANAAGKIAKDGKAGENVLVKAVRRVQDIAVRTKLHNKSLEDAFVQGAQMLLSCEDPVLLVDMAAECVGFNTLLAEAASMARDFSVVSSDVVDEIVSKLRTIHINVVRRLGTAATVLVAKSVLVAAEGYGKDLSSAIDDAADILMDAVDRDYVLTKERGDRFLEGIADVLEMDMEHVVDLFNRVSTVLDAVGYAYGLEVKS